MGRAGAGSGGNIGNGGGFRPTPPSGGQDRGAQRSPGGGMRPTGGRPSAPRPTGSRPTAPRPMGGGSGMPPRNSPGGGSPPPRGGRYMPPPSPKRPRRNRNSGCSNIVIGGVVVGIVLLIVLLNIVRSSCTGCVKDTTSDVSQSTSSTPSFPPSAPSTPDSGTSTSPVPPKPAVPVVPILTLVKNVPENAFEPNCVVDELKWFDNAKSAGESLKFVHDKLGIQPYVVFKKYDSSLKTDEDKVKYCVDWYKSHIKDEDTFLLMYFAEKESDTAVGYTVYYSGANAEKLAVEFKGILEEGINEYWFTDLSTDDVIKYAFEYTCDRITVKTAAELTPPEDSSSAEESPTTEEASTTEETPTTEGTLDETHDTTD